MDKIKVKLTYKDLAEGERWRPGFCPVALNLKREHNVEKIHVGVKVIEGEINGQPFVAPTPAEATDFIRDFDRGVPVKPIEFTLDLTSGEQREKIRAKSRLLRRIRELLADGNGEAYFAWPDSSRGFEYWYGVSQELANEIHRLEGQL